jgi:hypothetical protein
LARKVVFVVRHSLLLLQLGEFLAAELAGKSFTARPVSTIVRVYVGWGPEHIRRLGVQEFDFIVVSFDRAHRRSSRRRFAGRGVAGAGA